MSGGTSSVWEKGDSVRGGGRKAKRFLPCVHMGEWTFSPKTEFVRESKSDKNFDWTSGSL